MAVADLRLAAIVEAGRRGGYERMRLDTSKRQVAAIGLYQRLGFRQVEPYHEFEPELREWLVVYEMAF